MWKLLMASLAGYLRGHLPPQLYNILASVLINSYAICLFIASKFPHLTRTLNSFDLGATLISLLTLYFTLRLWYRSFTTALRVGWFFLKWGSLIGLLLYFFGDKTDFGRSLQADFGFGHVQTDVGWNWGQNFHDISEWLDSVLTSPQHKGRQRRTRNSRAESPPGIFDTFDQHKAYAERRRREERRRDRDIPFDQESPIDSVTEQISGAWQESGKKWWEKVGRAAGFMEDDMDGEPPSTSRRSKRTKKGKTSTR